MVIYIAIDTNGTIGIVTKSKKEAERVAHNLSRSLAMGGHTDDRAWVKTTRLGVEERV